MLTARKHPLPSLEKPKNPRSFSWNFDRPSDLGLYWLSQKKAWNAQIQWNFLVELFNTDGSLQKRLVLNFVDNCSAHSIDYSVVDNEKNHFRPQCMASVLQQYSARLVGHSNALCVYLSWHMYWLTGTIGSRNHRLIGYHLGFMKLFQPIAPPSSFWGVKPRTAPHGS